MPWSDVFHNFISPDNIMEILRLGFKNNQPNYLTQAWSSDSNTVKYYVVTEVWIFEFYVFCASAFMQILNKGKTTPKLNHFIMYKSNIKCINLNFNHMNLTFAPKNVPHKRFWFRKLKASQGTEPKCVPSAVVITSVIHDKNTVYYRPYITTRHSNISADDYVKIMTGNTSTLSNYHAFYPALKWCVYGTYLK